MKAFFRDLPLKSKLMTIIMVVSAAALLVASTAIVATESRKFVRDYDEYLAALESI